ncbi:MAG TPA: response regulator [Candidatus Saccharibacteria bacterium]|nr:response regulator [Candidatus Saccharibacteria bacterium]
MKPHVLLVEDDAWLAESYSRVLRKANYSVAVARDGDEAIRQVETKNPDVLLVDVMLEGQTILGLLHELQSYDDTAKLPVVVCSALTGFDMSVERLHYYGVRAILNKATVTPEQLVLTIQEVVTA